MKIHLIKVWLKIIIGKQRNGPIGKIRLSFLGEYVRFENHVHEVVEVAQYSG